MTDHGTVTTEQGRDDRPAAARHRGYWSGNTTERAEER